MTKSINKANSATENYFPSTDNSPPQKADVPSPPTHNQSASAERRVHIKGSAAWLNQQALQNNQKGDQPSLRRILSAPPTPAAADTPHTSANGFPAWSAQHMRKGPDLDVMYGSAQPPRAKPGRASGIQKTERNKDGMVIVHPGRIVLNPALTPELPALLDQVRNELRDGAVYKWNIAKNEQLMLAKSKLSGGEKLGLGHPTLVGGLKEPEARMGGELRFAKLGKDPEPVFYINNDSGRYSEYVDRNARMLKNTANRFKDLGFPVKEQWWLDKSEVPLGNPKVPAETGSSSHTAAPSADA